MREEQAEREAGSVTSSGGVNGPGHFEYEDSEWDVGIGNLIIDLDADIASHQTVMPSSGGVSNSALAPSAAQQQQQQQQEQQGLLKMKIKRTKPSPGTRLSETKHEIVKTNQEINGNQNDLHKRANGVPISTSGVTVTPVMRIPAVKTSPLLNGSPPVTVTPVPGGGKPNTSLTVAEAPPVKRIRSDACVGTSDCATMTEPDCLGPCEPGTHVSLEGIVWQETEGGVLVVNVTWRGKTYVGTLLDCTNHDWAPPRFCDSPSSDFDSRASRGRAAKRGRGGGTASSGTTPVPLGESPFSPMHSKLRLTVKGRRGFPATPPSPLTRRSKGRPPEETLGAAGLVAESKPVGLIECPEPNCSKKYRHINGLRYHQSHAHGGGESPVPGNNNDMEEAEEEEEEEPLPALADEIKMDAQAGTLADDLSSSAEDTQSSLPSTPAKDVDTPTPSSVPVISYNGASGPADERIPTPEATQLPDRVPTPSNGIEEPVRSPAYSDISDVNDQSPTPTPVPAPIPPTVEIIENLDKRAGIPESFPPGTFVAPFYPAFVPAEERRSKEEPGKPTELPKSFNSGPFLQQYGFIPPFQGFPANAPPAQERKNPREEVTIIKETRSPVPSCSNSNSSCGSVKRESTPVGRITPGTPSPKFRPPSVERDRRSEGMKPTMESHGPLGSMPYPYGLHSFPPIHMDPTYRGVLPSPFFPGPPLNFLQGSSFYPLPGMAPRSDVIASKVTSGSTTGGQVKVERSVIQGSRPLMSGGALQVTATPGAQPNPLLAGPSYPASTYAPGKPTVRP